MEYGPSKTGTTVKFCASSRGYTLEAFECVRHR